MTPADLPPLKDEVCPCCQGKGMIMAPSFSDSAIEIERRCRVCRGKGKLPSDWTDEEVQAYAKLAVRQALERVKKWHVNGKDTEALIRAIIKEYANE